MIRCILISEISGLPVVPYVVDPELVSSIHDLGLQNPISVTDGYVLIDGLRRLRALEALGATLVPVYITKGVDVRVVRKYHSYSGGIGPRW